VLHADVDVHPPKHDTQQGNEGVFLSVHQCGLR
jgi:hypothetical protein